MSVCVCELKMRCKMCVVRRCDVLCCAVMMRKWKNEISRQRNQFFLYLSSSIQTQPDVAKVKTWPALCPAPSIPRDTLTLTRLSLFTTPLHSFFPDSRFPISSHHCKSASKGSTIQSNPPNQHHKLRFPIMSRFPILTYHYPSINCKQVNRQLLLLPTNTAHQHSKHIDLIWARLAICFRPPIPIKMS